ncbi:MAG: lipid-A-disaccharide synthase [Planctomycetes bacterium]|nr:lipid-A-disaccharide synthase [Planctomycetota bacterium]
MIWCEVLLTLLRELVRAATVPFRLLGYLPFRHHWRRRAERALAAAAGAAPEVPEQALADFLAQQKVRRPRPHGDRPHLFVSAGEASGEAHAARLVAALAGELRVTAFGGHQLADAGATLRFALSDHAVMGVVGVLRQLPLILRAVADFLRLLRDDRPDLIVLVDYPGLHVVLAKLARRRGIPVLHYVAPQYWAWGPWRMRRYRRAVDATLTILPFETTFFRDFHVAAAYIGHPLLDELAAAPPDPGAVAAVAARRTLVLLPGSRRAEIDGNLPGMLRVAAALRAREPSLRIVVPHKNPRRSDTIRQLLRQHGAADVEHVVGPLSPWLAGARLVLVKSGTGSLEACLHETPTIVVYQLRSWLASLGYHNILSVPWIAAANLIAGRRVVPEHCFHGDAGWARVTADAERLWFADADRAAMLQDLAEVRRRLGAPGATARTARIVRRCFDLPDPA